jgi:membrane protein YdbS with pleckstrin-like domain
MGTETASASPDWHQLDPRKIQLDRITGWITTAVVSLGFLFGATIFALAGDDVPAWIRFGVLILWLPLTIGLAVIAYLWPPVEHRHARYRIDDELIEIQRGVVWRMSIAVPRSRVQHLDVTQGPVQRRFGLGVLVIYTAGTEHSQVTLDGLAYEVAQELRDRLLPRDAQIDGV